MQPESRERWGNWRQREIYEGRVLAAKGASVEEIRQEMFARFGCRPTRSTVERWIEETFGDHQPLREEASRRRSLERAVTYGDDLLLKLRVEDGLSYPTITVVLRRFLGVELTTNQVRYRLQQLGAPKNERKARYGEQNALLRVAA